MQIDKFDGKKLHTPPDKSRVESRIGIRRNCLCSKVENLGSGWRRRVSGVVGLQVCVFDEKKTGCLGRKREGDEDA